MTGRHIISVLMATTLFLGGCDKMSNKATPERLEALVKDGSKPERLAKVEARLAKTLGRKNSIADLSRLANDPVGNPQIVPLNALLAAAMQNNAEIAQAAQDINEADARRLAAVFGYLPQISMNYSTTTVQTQVLQTDNAVFQLGTATYPVINMAVELRQPILDMGRIYGIQLASTVRTKAEVAYIGAVQKAVYDTFDTYLEAAASRLRMDESGRRARLLGQQAQGESALSASGLNDQQAMRSLIAEKARIEADLSVETARYAETLGQLAYHTGLAVAGVQPSDVPASVMGAERQVTPAAAVESALKNNPELLAMAIDVVARDLGRKQAIATDFAPVLDLFAKMEQETRAGSRFGGGSVTQDTTMGVQLRLPIFNANGNGLRTVQANVDLRSGVVAYHATKRRIETEIAMTLQRMSQLTAAMGQMSTAAQQARANVDAEQALVASGQSTDLQLISRQLLESQLKEAAAEQRIEYLRAWARLQYLTGAMTADAL